MNIVFYSNYLNHHQVLVADELHKILGKGYCFVATMPLNSSMLKGGINYSVDKSYCIRAYEGGESYDKAMQLARDADVCVFGADALPFALERAKTIRANNTNQLSFEIAERWLKRGVWNLASPRLQKWLFAYHRYYKKAGFYRLCASAYTKKDDERLGAYKTRSYKWGYFTSVPEDLLVSEEPTARIMWCSRFLKLKHPELVILMASKLKAKGYRFHIDVYGDEGNAGKHEKVFTRKEIESLIELHNLSNCISLHGSKPNAEILEAMRSHDIFLFTSDRLEGWGAVANESMANGCVLVASDAIGSSPYLIKEGFNGFMFRSCDVDSLTEKVEWLLAHPVERMQMQKNAYMCMSDLWSPQVAAENLLTLIDCLKNNMETSIQEGPCSKA